MKKEIKNGVILLSIGIITSIGIILSKTNILASVNLLNLLASDVPYSNTTVQGAIDDLCTKATTINNELITCQTKLSTYINPDDVYFDLTTAKSNTTGTVFASKKEVYIKRNGTVHCFATNNYTYEKNHIQSAFTDISCSLYSNGSIDCD